MLAKCKKSRMDNVVRAGRLRPRRSLNNECSEFESKPSEAGDSEVRKPVGCWIIEICSYELRKDPPRLIVNAMLLHIYLGQSCLINRIALTNIFSLTLEEVNVSWQDYVFIHL